MIERSRDAAARAESSVEVVGAAVGLGGVESGEAVGSGDGDAALVGAVFVSVGLDEFEVSVDGEAVGSGLAFAGAVVGAATDPAPIFSSRP